MQISLRSLEQTPSWEWPEEAGQVIKTGLDSSDPAEQCLAAGLASDLVVMDDPIAAKLLGVLRSPAPEAVRSRAAAAFGPALEELDLLGKDAGGGFDQDYDAPVLSEERAAEVRRALRALFDDQGEADEVRRMCLEALVRSPEPWHAAAVERAYSSGDSHWRRTAVSCMGWLRGFEAPITEALESSDPLLLREALLAAGRAGVHTAGPRVVALARHASDSLVLLAAIEALGTLTPPGSARLLRRLSRHEDPEVALCARQALAERQVFSEPPPEDW